MMPKLTSPQKLKTTLSRLKRQGKKIVFTNGCFDILHAGHVMYLEKAKSLGDVLVLGLNSDRSVRKIKGPKRPLNSEKDRARVLAGLTAVDFIVIFSDPTPRDLISLLKPDVMVKGADYKISQIAGAREVLSWGGKVKLVKLLAGRSTTKLLKKIG